MLKTSLTHTQLTWRINFMGLSRGNSYFERMYRNVFFGIGSHGNWSFSCCTSVLLW